MSKAHPKQFTEFKDELIEKKEVKMNGGISLKELIEEAKEKTNEKRGLLAPPLTEEEKQAQKLANIDRRVLERWRLMLLAAQDNTLQKIIDSLTENVKLDEDIHQALTLEIFCLTAQPIVQTYGLFLASTELVYKEFEKLGIKIEKPSTPTLDGLLKEIQKRLQAVTTERKKKSTGED